MKLIIHQELSVPETEIIIKCAGMDSRLQKLIEQIRQYGFSLTGYQENREFQLPLESICFIDSADGRTFLYQEKEVYECRETLSSLERRLPHQHLLFETCETTLQSSSRSRPEKRGEIDYHP